MSLLACVLLLAQTEETIAVVNARILTVGKGEIDSGTILIRGGKFAEVGKNVKVPAGAKVVDGKGLTAFPGLVHAASRLGMIEGGGASGPAGPLGSALDELNPALEVFGQAARTGVTSYALHPGGGAIPGLGAVIRPLGSSKDEMAVEKAAFLRINMASNTTTKDAIRQAFDAARKGIEGEKRTPPAKPDERTQALMRAYKGELPVLVWVGGPGDLLHFWQVADAFADAKAKVSFVATSEVYKAAELLGTRKARLLLRPDLTFLPSTRDRVNPAAELARAGALVGLAPSSDGPEALEALLFRAAELVKHGLPREAALRAVTLVPAEMLGLEKRLGSVEAGKDADLLLFDGDPLAVSSKLRRVFIAGREAWSGE
jgi:imidazolonepropionase-like amidohydrolase